MCILLCTQSSLEPLSNIERFAVRSLFFLFFNHGEMSSIKVSREQIETFFVIRRVITTEIINYGFDRASSMLNIISVKMKGFFFFLPEKEKERDENLTKNVGLILKRENSKRFVLYYSNLRFASMCFNFTK